MAEINELYQEAEKLKDEGKLEESIAKLQEILAQDESHVISHLALAVVSMPAPTAGLALGTGASRDH